MFMGHIGIALAAKACSKQLSLLLLCLVAVAPDLVDFALEGTGHAHGAGLWTHSLVSMIGYAILVALSYLALLRDKRGALLLGAVAATHVLADLVTSSMPLWPNGPKLGLHLYVHRISDLLLESAVVLVGWAFYLRTLPTARRLSAASITMLIILLAMQGFMATMNIS